MSGINDAGQVVGYSSVDITGNIHAVVYSGGSFTDLNSSIGSTQSEARGINASGQVTGGAVFIDADRNVTNRPFVYSGGTATVLPTFLGGDTTGSAINAFGQIAGTSDSTNGGIFHAFIYSGGQYTDLGVPLGYKNSTATAINDSGQIVGNLYGHMGPNHTVLPDHAFLYSGGTIVELGRSLRTGEVRPMGSTMQETSWVRVY